MTIYLDAALVDHRSFIPTTSECIFHDKEKLDALHLYDLDEPPNRCLSVFDPALPLCPNPRSHDVTDNITGEIVRIPNVTRDGRPLRCGRNACPSCRAVNAAAHRSRNRTRTAITLLLDHVGRCGLQRDQEEDEQANRTHPLQGPQFSVGLGS